MAKLYYGTTHVIPNIQKTITTTLNVVPSQVEQQLTSIGADAYKLINVSAVTSSIDANIVTNNIKNNITILGITGNLYSEYDFVIPRMIDQNGKLIKCNKNYTIKLPNNVKDLDLNALRACCINDSYLTSVDLSSLVSISGKKAMKSAFSQCTNLTSVNLSGLESISGEEAMSSAFDNCTNLTSIDLSSLVSTTSKFSMESAFNYCTNLTTVDLSGLVSITGDWAMRNAFYGCSNLTSIDFTNLEVIGDSHTNNTNNVHMLGHFYCCFKNADRLTQLSFPNLRKIYCNGGPGGYNSYNYPTFYGNNTIQKMYFPKLTTIAAPTTNLIYGCRSLFEDCSSLTELHFGAANQAAIEATEGYSTAWGRGAGNVTIYFDL